MSRLEVLERENKNISPEELEELEQWLAEHKTDLWDKQIESDAKAGKLDKLADEAIEHVKAGNLKKL